MPDVIYDHRDQLLGAARDLYEIDDASADFGKAHTLHNVFLILETATFAGAVFAALLEGGTLAIVLACAGLVMVVGHIIMKRFEHERHQKHRQRVQARARELERKAQERCRVGVKLGLQLGWLNPLNWFRR
jgi:hypothetical protein